MMSDALFALMERKSFAQISITEICEEAGVGRKTFYRNFDTKEDIISFRLDVLRDDYEKGLLGIPMERRLGYHLGFLKLHNEELICLYRQGLSPMVNEIFSAFLPKTMPVWSEDPIEQMYRSEYVSAGVNAVVKTWITREFQESVEDVIALVKRARQISE